MSLRPEPPFSHGTPPKTGVLLVNLGTPDEPTPRAVRRYLKQFLSDPRVVEIPRPIWWLILNGIILNVRPAKTAAKYRSIWTKEGSPLKVHTERQTQLLRGSLGEAGYRHLVVDYAMRYGNPGIEAGIDSLKARHCDRILVLPLYPQYASSTTGTVMDELGRVLSRIRNVPALRLVRNFHDHPAYIDAIVTNLLAQWKQVGRPDFRTDKLVMTFHGLPRFHLDKGDPYHCECYKSARLIAEQLGLGKDDYVVTFQSRFGKAEWLQPYTDATLERLARAGTRRVDIICPGFAADCLETLEEIAMEGKDTFLHAGGKEFNYLAVANESAPFVRALQAVATDNLGDWLRNEPMAQRSESAVKTGADRALARGASR